MISFKLLLQEGDKQLIDKIKSINSIKYLGFIDHKTVFEK